MELDEDDKLQAMGVQLRELRKEQRLAHNMSLHWAPSYPEHWLRAHTAGGALAGSLRWLAGLLSVCVCSNARALA